MKLEELNQKSPKVLTHRKNKMARRRMTTKEYRHRVNNNYGHGSHSKPGFMRPNYWVGYRIPTKIKSGKFQANRFKTSKLLRLSRRA